MAVELGSSSSDLDFKVGDSQVQELWMGDQKVWPPSQQVLIERFDVNVNSNGQRYTLENTLADIDKAFVRLVGSSDGAGGGSIGDTGTEGPDTIGVAVVITSTTELTFYTANTINKKISGEVWRYVGPVGGFYEFISRGRSKVTLTPADKSSSTSISGVSNMNDVIPLYNGFSTNETSFTRYNGTTLGLSVSSGGTITFSRNNSNITTTIDAYYEAVEFIGSGWSVGHAISTSHSSAGTTGVVVDINESITGTGGSTFALSSWDHGMIMAATMQGDSTKSEVPNCMILVEPDISTSKVNIAFADASASNDGSAFVHILGCDAMEVHRVVNTNFPEGNNTYTSTSPPAGMDSSINTNEIALEWFPGSSGMNSLHPRGRLLGLIGLTPQGGELLSNQDLRTWVARNGDVVTTKYGYVDLSGLSV